MSDSKKCKEVFYYLHSKKYDVIFLQETHAIKAEEKMWTTQWGGKIWFSNGSKVARGVAIMFNHKLDATVHNVIRDQEGRSVILYATINNIKFSLTSLYAPNIDSPSFFQCTFKEIHRFSPDQVVIAGDFNLALDSRLDRSGCSTNNDKSAIWLNQHFANENLTDAWRWKHPDLNGYTWRRLKPSPKFSRLDYFIISDTFLQYINNIQVHPGYHTDHSSVELLASFGEVKCGPGYWKLNNSLLRDPVYVDKINCLIDIHLKTHEDMSRMDCWELLKLSVRGSSIQYTSRKQKSKKLLIEVLEKKLAQIDQDLDQAGHLFLDKEKHRRLISHDLETLIKEKTLGAQIRSKATWASQGEYPTKYYLNLEKRKAQNRTISRLFKENGDIVEDTHEILAEIKEFYQKLYTSQGQIDTSFIEKLDLPQISDKLRTELEEQIMLEELGSVLVSMQNSKSPGTDGLPCEWSKTFWPKIKDLFHSVILEVVEKKKMHLTARRGIISLLEKLDRNDLYLKTWRPLSLLNTDNKLYTKVLAKRLQRAQNQCHLIHPTQTGFMKGRHLAEGIIKIMQVIEYCEKYQKDALLVSFDFFKAFDTLKFNAMYKTLEAANFGPIFVDMVKIVFNEPLACAYNNGYWSQFFIPTHGCHQGCCFSPGIFTQVIELLGQGLQQSKDIQGITIGGTEIRLGQFADDLWTSLFPSVNNLNAVLNEIQSFSDFSGLKLNHEKSAVLKLGPWKNSDA